MIKDLILDLEELLKNNSKTRFLLAICGAPGAGKSTLAEQVVSEWNTKHPGEAVLVPLDGYHFSNEILQEKGLLPLKGIPSTFDVESFILKLKDLRSKPELPHGYPLFDRSIEASIDNAIQILPEHRLLVVEGNYLLLDSPPWHQLKENFDQSWFIDAPEELILPRLISRHEKAGKSRDAAIEKVNSTDLPNARLLSASAVRADRRIPASSLCMQARNE